MVTHSKHWERPRAVKLSTSDDAGFQPRTLIIAGLLMTGAMIAILFSAWNRKDYRGMFDQQVETQWLSSREVVDAAVFFAQGGVFENSNAPGSQTIDQTYVIPLIDRLQLEQQLHLQVILDDTDQNRAYALIAQVPSDRESRNAIRTAVLEAAEEFPGLLYQKWGRQWLAIDFFDEQEITPLKRAGVLEKLKAGQRRMD